MAKARTTPDPVDPVVGEPVVGEPVVGGPVVGGPVVAVVSGRRTGVDVSLTGKHRRRAEKAARAPVKPKKVRSLRRQLDAVAARAAGLGLHLEVDRYVLAALTAAQAPGPAAEPDPTSTVATTAPRTREVARPGLAARPGRVPADQAPPAAKPPRRRAPAGRTTAGRTIATRTPARGPGESGSA